MICYSFQVNEEDVFIFERTITKTTMVWQYTR